MSQTALEYVERGIQFARQRASVLAGDAVNARTPGFSPSDLTLSAAASPQGLRFSAALQEVDARGPVGVLEYAMGAQAKNMVTYRALAEQERAMLRELRTVAEEARR